MPFARARAAVLLLFALAALGAAAYWIELGVPVAMAAAPGGRIACVSYAPYRKPGESPFTPGYTVSAQRIDEDLKALSRRFDCVRTYSVGQGLDQVPAIARRYGMKVLLGAWLSRNPVENAAELADAIAVANANRDVIRAIVVGNEVLLRGELPQRTIAEHLRMVRAATGLPVTYADVWEFWLKYREVAPAVDFITIHILPYWEDEPVAVDHAVAHVDAIYRRMQAAFPGREFLIGETGWPSEGRQRWQAVPSRVNEARFFREFMAFVATTHLPYNVIEAFDQPWKRALEGTVGGYWGLYDDRLHDKFGLSGPVVEEPRWWIGLACGALGAVAFAIVGAIVWRDRSWLGAGARALAGLFIAAFCAAQVRHLFFAERDAVEWLVTGGATVLSVVTATWVTGRIVRWMTHGGRHDHDPPGSTPMASAFMRGTVTRERVTGERVTREKVTREKVTREKVTREKVTREEVTREEVTREAASFADRVTGALQAFWLVAAVVVDLLLVFDARYRDFPTLLFAPAIVAFVGLAIARGPGAWHLPREIEERALALALVAGAAVILVMELPINGSADRWVALCVAFAAATWINGARHGPGDRPAVNA